jgi:ABC-2 type transport system ATP-binding protein
MDDLRGLLEAEGASLRREGRADTMLVHGSSLERIGTLAAENGIPVFELTRAVSTLEDRFLELTGESGNVR